MGWKKPQNDVVYPSIDELEQVFKEEQSEIVKALKQSDKNEKGRFEDATDGDHDLILTFQNSAQKQEFLEKSGIIKICNAGLLEGYYVVDGMKAAKALGIKLKTPIRAIQKKKRKDANGEYLKRIIPND